MQKQKYLKDGKNKAHLSVGFFYVQANRVYLCIVGGKRRKKMTRQEIMSDHIDRLEAVLHRMETERKAAKEQLEMYMHTIDKNIEMYDKRADANDKRFAALRGTLIGIVVFVLGVSFTGSVAINSSLDKKLEEDDIREMDYVPTSSVLRGDYSVIEGVLEVIEYSTGLNKEDSDDYEVLMKRKAYQEVSGEITRGN